MSSRSQCPSCGLEWPAGTAACYKCGASMNPGEPARQTNSAGGASSSEAPPRKKPIPNIDFEPTERKRPELTNVEGTARHGTVCAKCGCAGATLQEYKCHGYKSRTIAASEGSLLLSGFSRTVWRYEGLQNCLVWLCSSCVRWHRWRFSLAGIGLILGGTVVTALAMGVTALVHRFVDNPGLQGLLWVPACLMALALFVMMLVLGRKQQVMAGDGAGDSLALECKREQLLRAACSSVGPGHVEDTTRYIQRCRRRIPGEITGFRFIFQVV